MCLIFTSCDIRKPKMYFSYVYKVCMVSVKKVEHPGSPAGYCNQAASFEA